MSRGGGPAHPGGGPAHRGGGAAPRGGGDGRDVIAAVATPPGEGALGIVRLSGPDALRVAQRFVRAPLAPRQAALALIHDGGKPVDRAIAVFFAGPDTYTGEDLVELSVHGSPYLLSRTLELALSSGARAAEPGEFTRRAFVNGRLDLAQAEAVGLLIRARTELAARAAFEQLEGRLSRTVEELRRAVIGALAVVEASLDHPDDDLPAFEPAVAAKDILALRDRVARLEDSHRIGRLAAEGARVSIVGRPNAGKSSLLNALLGRERAIVADEPGTTRDTLEEAADLRGLRAVLVDTAGLRDEKDAGAVELEGMRRARRSLASSDVALVVVDRSADFAEEDRRILEEAASGGRPVVVALNKSDLPGLTAPGTVSSPRLGGPTPCIEVSAATGEGVPRLVETLRERLLSSWSSPEGEPLVLNVRHRLALGDARAALDRASALTGGGPELAAVHLREALAALGAVVGHTPPEEVLREVFSRFCVGK